nr:MAG TPA: hypothetical protein [Bacteriophage sp.]
MRIMKLKFFNFVFNICNHIVVYNLKQKEL